MEVIGRAVSCKRGGHRECVARCRFAQCYEPQLAQKRVLIVDASPSAIGNPRFSSCLIDVLAAAMAYNLGRWGMAASCTTSSVEALKWLDICSRQRPGAYYFLAILGVRTLRLFLLFSLVFDSMVAVRAQRTGWTGRRWPRWPSGPSGYTRPFMSST
jgi:hypothetical protein